MKEEAISKKIFSPEQAKQKAEAYCAYQERSQQEVRDKLYSWGLYSADVENIIVQLIDSNFLNEERFATAYTLGKFRIKHWGKIKIKQGLKLKRVPERMIQKALSKIDLDDYEKNLRKLLEKKEEILKEQDKFKRFVALSRYAASKGYEQELISGILRDPER